MMYSTYDFKQPEDMKDDDYSMFKKVAESLYNGFSAHVSFVIFNGVNDKFPGSYGKIQLAVSENELMDAIFDVFPSGYVHSKINGECLIHDSHKKLEKYLKTLSS